MYSQARSCLPTCLAISPSRCSASTCCGSTCRICRYRRSACCSARLVVLQRQRQRLGNARHAYPPVLLNPMFPMAAPYQESERKGTRCIRRHQVSAGRYPAHHHTRFTLRFDSRSARAIRPRCAGRPRPNRRAGSGGTGDEADTTGCPRARAASASRRRTAGPATPARPGASQVRHGGAGGDQQVHVLQHRRCVAERLQPLPQLEDGKRRGARRN